MNKKKILGVSLLVALIAVLAIVAYVFTDKPEEKKKDNVGVEQNESATEENLKKVGIEVINSKGESTKYELNTDASYLREVMDETDGLEFSGTDSEYGLMVDTVNGEKADFNADGAYWSFYVNGEYCMNGIDTEPVKDGDNFQIKYEK